MHDDERKINQTKMIGIMQDTGSLSSEGGQMKSKMATDPSARPRPSLLRLAEALLLRNKYILFFTFLHFCVASVYYVVVH